MTTISASQVKELREMTGLGMMECKSALAEAGGDLGRAEEILRIKSGARASKAASRVAAEGVVGAWLAPDAKLGALVELNCETDFVARNEEFAAFARELAEAAAKTNPADVQALAGGFDRGPRTSSSGGFDHQQAAADRADHSLPWALPASRHSPGTPSPPTTREATAERAGDEVSRCSPGRSSHDTR